MDKLVGPLLGGINAGDPDKISLSSGVPYLASAASLDVSLIRSIQKFIRMSDRDPKAPVFLTHPEGLGKVVETLEIELEGKIVVNELSTQYSPKVKMGCCRAKTQLRSGLGDSNDPQLCFGFHR